MIDPMELIPGLPNDVSIECLIRVHFDHLSEAASVSEHWNSEIRGHEFWNRRRTAGFTRPVIVMAQAQGKPAAGTYRLVISDPERGFWNELPPIPGFSNGLPLFCRIVGVGNNLVVMGGCDPITWKVLDSVFVYDFLSSKWRNGACIPGKRRFLFGCASDSHRNVIVAGGHDEQKYALRSAVLYDVLKDEWITLPDMAKERDECACIFHRGKFHVISGYCTDRQGGFERDAEVFDDQTTQWTLNDGFLDIAKCPGPCASCLDDGGLYMWQDGHVSKWDGTTWTKLSSDVSYNTSYLTAACSGKLLAMAYEKSNGSLDACYIMNFSNERSKKIEIPTEYKTHVQSACYLEM